MNSEKIAFGAVAATVASLFGGLSALTEWWRYTLVGDPNPVGIDGITTWMGKVAVGAGLAGLLFGGAYILMGGPKNRRALQALVGLAAAVLIAMVVIAAFSVKSVVADQATGPYSSTRLAPGLIVAFVASVVAFAGAMVSAIDKPGETVIDQMEGR
jgi:hypothetical protein